MVVIRTCKRKTKKSKMIYRAFNFRQKDGITYLVFYRLDE